MGFEGLLYLVDRCLSIDLCYWLMTRIDPCNELFRAPDGHEYKLSKDQVRWILGIPKGDKVVPRRVRDEEMKSKVRDIEKNFGVEWEAWLKTSEKVIKHKGIRINSALIKRAKGSWGEEEEAEFKTVFLILALHLVLCPTQSYQLGPDLVPALTCAMQAKNYDWCGLVLEKLFDSCCRFGKKFYANGYAKGYGGCSIFLAIFYLDRLDRNPVMWCRWPRIKVWTKAEMVKAGDEDRLAHQGDFGKLGCIDVAYGKKHPREARETDVTSFVEEGLSQDIESLQSKEEEAIIGRSNGIYKRKYRKRRRISALYPGLFMFIKKAKTKRLQGGVPKALAQACKILVDSKIAEGGCPSQSVIDNSEQNSCHEKPIEGEGRNEDGGNGEDGYLPLAEEIHTPVTTNFAVVTEPVGERGDKMPSPTNEGTVTSHGCTEHNGIGASPSSSSSCFICLLSSCVLDFEKMHIGKDAETKNGSVEENGEGVLPCLLSSCNVMEDSGLVDSVEKLYSEDILSSENNNSHNKSIADINEIVPSSSLGIAFEKAIRGMDLHMEQVKKCREKCVKMSSNRSVDSVAEMHMETFPSCNESTNHLEISRVNEGIPSQIITHQRGVIQVSSSTNTLMADIDQLEMIHEDISCINAGKSSRHSEGVQPQGETEIDTTNDQGKAGKVNAKLVNGSCDDPVIIIADDSAGEKENDDFDPFKAIDSELEARISKLEKKFSRKLASKLSKKKKER
ncbi:uncharacterized protein LOC110723799 [Chenopodium quinoa]|uniref:uncharacterized protein LOC110723799 n=1 Tax=Chenopodium quinoa TaxID=63459 RepID=UPI000B77F22B|nr:uncharacterized protein LOC110723799 [Chenopodium quinoa]XP_021758864.1 uncharacterized protein LOC110723799 [Chenopodium quinoa]